MSRDLITPNVLGNKVGAVALTLQNGSTDIAQNVLSDEGKMHVLPHYWNPGTLAYEVATGGGSGVGTEVKVTNTVTVSGALTDAQLRATPVPVSESKSNASSVTSVTATTSSQTLLSSDTARTGVSIHNDSTASLYLKLGATAGTTTYTLKMAANAHYEAPFAYTGRIDGLWDTASGAARITALST